VGPPGIGFGSGLSASASSSAKSKAPQPDAAVAAAVAAAREQARARRRHAKQRGHGDEFMDMDIEVDPDWGAPPEVPSSRGCEPAASTVASDRGVGTLGFAGTVSKDSAQAAGLITLSGDEFGGGQRMPMLPSTWDSEAPEEDREDS
jgi:PPE-repeat protein